MRGHPPTTRRLLGRVFKRLSKPDVWFAGEGAFDARGKRTSGYNTEATRFSVYEAIVFESRHRRTSDQYWRSERIDSACTAIMRALSIRGVSDATYAVVRWGRRRYLQLPEVLEVIGVAIELCKQLEKDRNGFPCTEQKS